MKHFYLVTIFFILPFFSFSQSIIWEENFDEQVGKGVSGDNSGGLIVDLDDVNWTLDYSQCTFSAEDDFVKVAPYFSGGRFTARDCDGEAIWESDPIDISDYTDIQVAANIGETGSSNNAASKYIKLYTVVDGIEKPFTNNPEGLGNFASLTASSVISSGSELKIRVKLRTDFAQNVYFDNVKVSGRSNKLDVTMRLRPR
ncbi:MAG: hypothetical protein CR996_02450 [Draconibacterium sp.]|nr:MAG: hypothetical protein CR996_02450 [Draconibacterium sp.]